MEQEASSVTITYETLFELLRREKNREELQELDANFYEDVISYLKEKMKILQQPEKAGDIFVIEEKERTITQLKNIRKIISELYDRREKKIIGTALIKSRTKSNLIDTTKLLVHERQMYEEIVDNLNKYREGILIRLMEGNQPKISSIDDVKKDDKEKSFSYFSTASDTAGSRLEQRKEDKDKALKAEDMGKGYGRTGAGEGMKKQDIERKEKKSEEEEIEGKEKTGKDEKEGEKGMEDSRVGKDEEVYEKESAIKTGQENSIEMKRIRFLYPVPKFLDKELKEYGPFKEEDKVEVPDYIAKILVDKGKADMA